MYGRHNNFSLKRLNELIFAPWLNNGLVSSLKVFNEWRLWEMFALFKVNKWSLKKILFLFVLRCSSAISILF